MKSFPPTVVVEINRSHCAWSQRMFVELLPAGAREKMHQLHARMTACALVVIFGQTQEAADEAVARFRHVRFGEAPASTRDQLLHDDPVNLAAEIAGQIGNLGAEPFATGINRYDAEFRPVFEAEASTFFEKKVQPIIKKLKITG